MNDSADGRFPFEIETEKKEGSSSSRSSGPAPPQARHGFPPSALFLLIALTAILGYVAYRQLGGGEATSSGQELVEASEGETAAASKVAPPTSAEKVAEDEGTSEPAGGSGSDTRPRPDSTRSQLVISERDPLSAARRGDYARAAELWVEALSAHAGPETYTLQVSANCDTANLKGLFTGSQADPDTFLLPVSVKGRPCYRVCYGLYMNRADAEARARSRRSGGSEPGNEVARIAMLADLLLREDPAGVRP